MLALPGADSMMDAVKRDVIILFIAAFRMGKWITTCKPVRAAAERHSQVLLRELGGRRTE